MFNKFNNGKIYKVTNTGNDKTYYGSTINSLSQRISAHKCSYKKYVSDGTNKVSIFDLFNAHGVEICEIELVEEYPCNCRKELLMREGMYIRNNDCINSSVAGRGLKQYYRDNVDKFRAHNKAYYEKNKNKIRRKQRLLYNMKVLLQKFKEEELQDI